MLAIVAFLLASGVLSDIAVVFPAFKIRVGQIVYHECIVDTEKVGNAAIEELVDPGFIFIEFVGDLVRDELRKIITKELVNAGHTIIGEASNGDEAIEMYKSLSPDVVTMDITMRGMDGFTAAQEILAIDPAAKILILSNLNEEKYREKAEKLGVLGLVNKHKSSEILELIE